MMQDYTTVECIEGNFDLILQTTFFLDLIPFFDWFLDFSFVS